jgi:hypothetical protein
MLKRIDAQHAEEQEDRRNRVAFLQAAISSGKLTPDAMDAAIDELGETTSGGGKGKKGGEHLDILKKLVGRVAKADTPQPFEQRIQGAKGAAPQTFGAIPQRQSADPAQAELDAPPAPPKRPHVFKTQEDLDDEQINFEKRRQQEVTGPAEKQKAEEEAARQEAKDQAAEARQKAKNEFAAQQNELKRKMTEDLNTAKEKLQLRRDENKANLEKILERERVRGMLDSADIKNRNQLKTLNLRDAAATFTQTYAQYTSQIKQAQQNIAKYDTLSGSLEEKRGFLDKHGIIEDEGMTGVRLETKSNLDDAKQQLERLKDAQSYLNTHRIPLMARIQKGDETAIDEANTVLNQADQIAQFGKGAANEEEHKVGDIVQTSDGRKLKIKKIEDGHITDGEYVP